MRAFEYGGGSIEALDRSQGDLCSKINLFRLSNITGARIILGTTSKVLLVGGSTATGYNVEISIVNGAIRERSIKSSEMPQNVWQKTEFSPPLTFFLKLAVYFISRDPLSGAEFSQGTNLYAYCANNYLNTTDPTGKSFLAGLGNFLTGAGAGAASGAITGAITGFVLSGFNPAGAAAGAVAGAIAGGIAGGVTGLAAGGTDNYNGGASALAGGITGGLGGITGGAADAAGVIGGVTAGALTGGVAGGLATDWSPSGIESGVLTGGLFGGLGGLGAANAGALGDFAAGLLNADSVLVPEDTTNYMELMNTIFPHHCPGGG